MIYVPTLSGIVFPNSSSTGWSKGGDRNQNGVWNGQAPCTPCSTENIKYRAPCTPCSTENIRYRDPCTPCSTENIRYRAPCTPCSTENIKYRAPCTWKYTALKILNMKKMETKINCEYSL